MSETNVVDLGRIAYPEAHALQKRLVDQRANGEIPDTLLLLEHDHVVTKGRGTHAENLLLIPKSVPVVEVERGGDVTYHGPGQLVGYPILKLPREPPDVRGHLRRIEEVLIRTLADFGIQGVRREKMTGVWVETGEGWRKVASIGVAVSRGVSYHGFALNVSTDLSYFGLIRPCGYDADVMTSLERLLGRRVALDEAKRALQPRFEAVFGATIRYAPGAIRASPHA